MILSAGASISLTELGNLPQADVERLALLHEVQNVIAYGLEV